MPQTCVFCRSAVAGAPECARVIKHLSGTLSELMPVSKRIVNRTGTAEGIDGVAIPTPQGGAGAQHEAFKERRVAADAARHEFIRGDLPSGFHLVPYGDQMP